jgi:hypothetical protein
VGIKLTTNQLKSVQEYCKLNNIEDVDKFISKCYVDGFNIKKYGLLGDDSEKIGGIEEKQVEIEVIKEIRVEVPVEVVKYVDVPVEIIKEIEVIQYVDREVEKEVIREVPVEKIVSKIEYIYDKKEGDDVPNLDNIWDENKVKKLETTLQKLRNELKLKNEKINELENKLKNLETNNQIGVVYMKGSNITQNL